MTPRSTNIAAYLACALLVACSEATEEHDGEPVADSIDRLELRRHVDLLAHMSEDGSTLAPFATDGCSGGLSIGWEYLAVQIETVQALHGNQPPWEDCCVAHDRLYHAAVPADATALQSFTARRQADAALRSCVTETALERATTLSNDYEVTVETVERVYTTIADLMYRAVRVGGVPCSGLPWRWGYGWPECE